MIRRKYSFAQQIEYYHKQAFDICPRLDSCLQPAGDLHVPTDIGLYWLSIGRTDIRPPSLESHSMTKTGVEGGKLESIPTILKDSLSVDLHVPRRCVIGHEWYGHSPFAFPVIPGTWDSMTNIRKSLTQFVTQHKNTRDPVVLRAAIYCAVILGLLNTMADDFTMNPNKVINDLPMAVLMITAQWYGAKILRALESAIQDGFLLTQVGNKIPVDSYRSREHWFWKVHEYQKNQRPGSSRVRFPTQFPVGIPVDTPAAVPAVALPALPPLPPLAIPPAPIAVPVPVPALVPPIPAVAPAAQPDLQQILVKLDELQLNQRDGGRRPVNNAARGEIACTRCGGAGHTHETCTSPPIANWCEYCERWGHEYANCRNQRNRQRQQRPLEANINLVGAAQQNEPPRQQYNQHLQNPVMRGRPRGSPNEAP
ncbi:hypothetical protein R1sor_019463 [Riccia sorocarpa]|uniref:CCHC-type domain-containing protein n=1 Tax=Riccia sorocarpa TaxID=122646 RepID=A0ABD3IGR6_9MARC